MDCLEKQKHKLKRPKSSGAIKFFSAEYDENNGISDKEETNVTTSHSNSRSRLPPGTSDSILRIGSSTSSSGNSHHIKEWINLKSLINIRDRHSAESNSVKRLYGTILSNEENFVKGIDQFLNEQALLNLRKKEILYKKWQERVYIPLRKKVEKVIDEGFDQIEQQRRKEYENYIAHVNKKEKVFLNIFSPEEYDPLTLYKPSSIYALHAKTPRLNDPLLKSERQRIAEDKIVLRCETGEVLPDRVVLSRRLPPQPLVPLGRSGGKLSTWLSVSLLNMDGPDRDRARQRMIGKANKSDIDFAAWNSVIADPELIDKELRIQKKRHFKLPSTMPTQVPTSQTINTKSSVRFSIPPVTSTA